MTLQIIDCVQGEPEWFAARAGIPTASEFATVMSEGRADGIMPNAIIDAMVKAGCSASQLAAAVKAAKSRNSNPAALRAKYIDRLAAEIVTGQPDPDSYTNAHMERGKVMEDEARDLYALLKDTEPQRVGFLRNGQKGASPDSLLGADGGLEIKTAIPTIHLPRLRSGKLPPEHRAQVQGSIWVAEREWWDFMSYWPGLPPLIVRVFRDEEYIAKLAVAVAVFNEELESVVASIRTYENFKGQVAA